MNYEQREEHQCTAWNFFVKDIGKQLKYRENNPIYVNRNDVAMFGSSMKGDLARISNFSATAPFSVPSIPGFTFNSAEAAWVSRRVHEADRHRFAVGGDLSTLEEGAAKVFDKDPDKKVIYWGPKKTGKPAMLGIIPKMAVNPKRMKKLGLTPSIEYSEEHRSQEHIDEIIVPHFFEILVAKYSNDKKMLAALLQTEDKHLVEFSRGAERETNKGRPPLWTGYVSTTQLDAHGRGKLCGNNLQGEIQMMVRSYFASKVDKPHSCPVKCEVS